MYAISFKDMVAEEVKMISSFSALIKEAITKGIIITVSAGNEGPSNGSVVFPGNLAEVITVGSASKNVFEVYKYSSRGPAIYNRNTLIPKPNTWCIGEDVVGFTTEGRKVIKNGSSISCCKLYVTKM